MVDAQQIIDSATLQAKLLEVGLVLHRVWEAGLYLLYPDGSGGHCKSMKHFHEVYQLEHPVSLSLGPMTWEAARRQMCSALVEEALTTVGQGGLQHLTATNLNQLYKLMPDKSSHDEPYARPAGAVLNSMRECVDLFVARVEAAGGQPRPVNKQVVMQTLVNEQLGNRLQGIRKRAKVWCTQQCAAAGRPRTD